MLSTPVLLLVFNRPDVTQKTFDQIRKVQPHKLFIAADGPRVDKPDDDAKCEATRAIINQINWACEVQTLFREQNRGCGYGPAEAITWFFEHVEEGIILEDDCLASIDFFPFCEELLIRYRDDEKVYMISGTNPAQKWKSKRSYLFSAMGFSWGWASWRRAWQKFDYSASQWATSEGKDKIKRHLNNEKFYKHFAEEFDYYFKEIRGDVWDFQWLFYRYYNQSYGIVPTVNLVTNIGFDDNATHTFDERVNTARLPTTSLGFPLIHPKDTGIDSLFDWYVFERFLSREERSVVKKILLKVTKNLITSDAV